MLVAIAYRELTMLVSKIGDDLAVRLSAEDVERLGLKEGDEVEITRADETALARRTRMKVVRH